MEHPNDVNQPPHEEIAEHPNDDNQPPHEEIVEQTDDAKQPSAFKLAWEAKKLLKRSKKKAKNNLVQKGHSPKEATGMIKQALKNIQSKKPEKRASGRGS
jgi:hypothetical protein